jgi:hypothetical protein
MGIVGKRRPKHLPVGRLMHLSSSGLLHLPFAGNAASLQALLASIA